MPLIPKAKAWHWTSHARSKMWFYGLSEARVRRVINSPKRKEEGIAPKTIAMMQIAGTTKGDGARKPQAPHDYQRVALPGHDETEKRNCAQSYR